MANNQIPFLDGWTIKMLQIPEYPRFKEEYVERIDKRLAQLMLESDDPNIPAESKTLFKTTIVDRLTPSGELHVRYDNRKGCGRFYTDDDAGLTPQSRYIKNTLYAYQGGIDFDMKKSYPNICLSLAKMNNVNLPAIECYTQNYDAIVADMIEYYHIDGQPRLAKDQVKWLFSMILFGGGHDAWKHALANPNDKDRAKGYKPVIIADKPLFPFAKEYKKDAWHLREIICSKNLELLSKILDPAKDRYDNESSLMSYYFGIIENHILHVSIEKFIEWGYLQTNPNRFSLAYDGFNAPPFQSDKTHSQIMDELTAYIRAETGLECVTWVQKEYDPDTVLSPLIQRRKRFIVRRHNTTPTSVQSSVSNDLVSESSEVSASGASSLLDPQPLVQEPVVEQPPSGEEVKRPVFANNDNEASDIMLERIKDILIPCQGQMFLKVGHIWINDKDRIDDILLKTILESEIRKKIKNGEQSRIVPYCQNVAPAKAVRTALYAKLNSKTDGINIYEKFHTTTRGRLCFKDGVLDFRTKRFYTWDEVDFEFYSTVMINREYGSYCQNPNREIIDTIKRDVFGNMYGSKLDLALHFLSRALAGEIGDKVWSNYTGNRDCGKGVKYDLLRCGFEDYVNSFELKQVLVSEGKGSRTEEVSRKLYWLLDLQFVRLGISQETPDELTRLLLSGEMFKKMAGGGDTQIARRNYDRFNTHFILATTFDIMGNHPLEADTPDVFEKCVQFASVCQFKSREEIDRMRADGVDERILNVYKVADPSIKERCKTVEWGNAVVYLMMENYKDHAVPIYRSDDADFTPSNSLRGRILENFEITGDRNDIIPCEEAEFNIGGNKKKVAIELASLGVEKRKNTRGELRNKWCYYGIRNMVEDTDIESDNE
jgi:hypothetical protein